MVCQRRLEFEQMPPEQQKHLIASIVPERYKSAEISHLPIALQTKMSNPNNAGVLLWGDAGVGKTYAMAALAKRDISEGFLVHRIHYETLCLRLRDTFKPKAVNTEWGIIEPLLNCDHLFIEDVGTSKSIGQQESDFSLRTFLVLLDMRIESCKPTFITSNKSVENLTGSFDERIGDRLKTFQVCKLGGKSKREEWKND